MNLNGLIIIVFDIFVIFKVFLMTFYRSSSLQMPLETFSL